jgi:hypothetical protein
MRGVDLRAVAAGMFGAAGAFLVASGVDGGSRVAEAIVAVAIGCVLAGVTWGRFPAWRDRPSRLRWVPLAAAVTLLVAVVIWLST